MKTKICCTCKQEQSIDNFYRDKHTRDKLSARCRSCCRRRRKVNYVKDKDKFKKYYQDNREDILRKRKIYYRNNRDKIVAKNSKYISDRTREDIDFKIRRVLRSRLNHALNKNNKAGSAIRDLGCTIEELKKHLEDQFVEGMSWDNHGLHGWHIDHIIPLSEFNLTDPEELKKACHYTNLQPLWSKDNWSKH